MPDPIPNPQPASPNDDIVIVARQAGWTGNSIGELYAFLYGRPQLTQMPYSSGGGSTGNPGTTGCSIYVPKIQNKVTSGPAKAAAQNAANNLSKAIIDAEIYLQSVPPNTIIKFGPALQYQITAGEVLAILQKSTFLITDLNYANGGFGKADGVKFIDEINYRIIDGMPEVGLNDYADPNYQNGIGMFTLLLHELGHMTPAGVQFNSNSRGTFYSDPYRPPGSYEYSDYVFNNEAFVNNFALNAGTAIGRDTSTVASTFAGGTYVESYSAIAARHALGH